MTFNTVITQRYRRRESSIDLVTYMAFPFGHWTRIRTNNVIKRLNRTIGHRTRVVGNFPEGNSTLMLLCVWLCYMAGTQWGNQESINMKHLQAAMDDTFLAG